MKVFILIFIVFSISIQTIAQNGKYTEKLSQFFEEEEFYKVINYKTKKESDMAANSLYLKGLANYTAGYYKKTIEYMKLAIEKGPVEYRFYYFKSISEMKVNQFEDAIKSIDLSIGLLPDDFSLYATKGDIYYEMEELNLSIQEYKIASTYSDAENYVFKALGGLCLEANNYEEAEIFYNQAMEKYGKDSEEYRNLNYNLGLCQQVSKQPKASKETFENQIQMYPDDYQAYSKLIQANFALGNYEVGSYTKVLFDAFTNNDLPRNYRSKYCLDQFEENEQNIKFFRNFEEIDSEPIIKRNVIFVSDKKDEEVSYRIYSCLDTIGYSKDSTSRKYIWYKLQNDTLFGFDHHTFDSSTPYTEIKSAYLEIINDKATSNSALPNFEKWLDQHSVKTLQGNGDSFETAITAESIPWEYEYLREHFPDYKMVRQKLIFHKGKPYDIIEFKTKTGKTMEIFFDVSNFFGK